jgi:hypothetical protein
MFQPASVDHPGTIAGVVGYMELSDNSDQKGDVLLVLRDEHGTVITLQLHRIAADSLLRTLEAGPTPARG